MKNPILIGFLFSNRLIRAGALLMAAIFLAGSLLDAQAQTGPTPYPDPHNESAWAGTGPIRVFPWMVDNRNYFWTVRDKNQGAVVFVGDSLLGNWGLAKVKTEKAFPKLKLVANRAIGGDVSRGVLFRLQEDVLDLHPEAVVILIGTNDLSAKAPIDGIVSNLTAILDEAQKAYPTMPIILCNIPPRNSKEAAIDPSQVTELNGRIAKLVQGREHVALFDTYSLFALPDGTPDPVNYKKDLLHPSDVGYAKLGDALGKVFEQLKLQ
jgi:lysophospholipase L1-like esterase